MWIPRGCHFSATTTALQPYVGVVIGLEVPYICMGIWAPKVKGHGPQAPKFKFQFRYIHSSSAKTKAATEPMLTTQISLGPRMCLLVVSTPEVKDHGPLGAKCECQGYAISQQLQLRLSPKLGVVIALDVPHIYVTHGPHRLKAMNPRVPNLNSRGTLFLAYWSILVSPTGYADRA